MKAVYKSMKRAVGIKSKKPPKDGDDDVAAVASEEARGRSMTVAVPGAAAGLWSSPDEDAKQAFQRDKWLPFFREVDGAVKATRKRYEEGVGFEAVLPPQADWAAWTTRCRALTLEWHGSPNVSMLYEALIECSEHDGEAPYRFEQVPQKRSADGWVRALDAGVRGSFYGKGVARPERHDPLKQQVGESPIDNTILPAVMTTHEARVLLVGNRIRGFLVAYVRKKQEKYVAALVAQGALQPGVDEGGREAFGAALAAVPAAALAAAGVDAASTAWARLKAKGAFMVSFGQLTIERQRSVDAFLDDALKQVSASPKKASRRFSSVAARALSDARRADAPPPPPEDPALLAEFVAFEHAHPGRVFRGDESLHERLVMAALLSPEFRVLKRSVVEQFTDHRYIATPWTRKVPLVGLGDGGERTVLRDAGAAEFSRLRKNAFPYADSHGLGVTSGGVAEAVADDGGAAPKSLAYELGNLHVVDGGAKLGNWWNSDFEKNLSEVVALNPLGPPLRGEAYHDVGQNPRAASSIGATQHTQLMRGGAYCWPLLRLASPARTRVTIPGENGGPDATDVDIDLCTVGAHADAFLLVLESSYVSSPPAVRLLQDLRLHLIGEYEAKAIDFNLMSAPLGHDGESTNRFRANLAVVAALRKDWPVYENPLTGEKTSDEAIKRDLPCPTVDASQGKGNFFYNNDVEQEIAMRGRPAVAALYDFNRVPGARAIVAAYLADKFGFADRPDVAPTCVDVPFPRVGHKSAFAGKKASRKSLA